MPRWIIKADGDLFDFDTGTQITFGGGRVEYHLLDEQPPIIIHELEDPEDQAEMELVREVIADEAGAHSIQSEIDVRRRVRNARSPKP